MGGFEFPMTRRSFSTTLLALPCWGQSAQQKQKEEEGQPAAISVEVDVVNILCTVRDKNGAIIANLTKDDFRVAEDGKAQTIKYFTRETDVPLTIGLLVDVSGSQENLIEIERRAAYQFFSQVLRKKDMAFLISFGAEAELLQDMTNSVRLLEEGLGRLRLNAGAGAMHTGPIPSSSTPRGTLLYEAVYLAATEKLRGEVGRKVLVLITDGVDQGSRVKLATAVETAQKADAIIYAIYYVDQSAYAGRGGIFMGTSDSALKKMAEETGGRVLKVDRNHTLAQIFEEIQQEMRSQYAIGYSPLNEVKDGSFRRLEVVTSQKNYKVQARRGYYAIKPEAR